MEWQGTVEMGLVEDWSGVRLEPLLQCVLQVCRILGMTRSTVS